MLCNCGFNVAHRRLGVSAIGNILNRMFGNSLGIKQPPTPPFRSPPQRMTHIPGSSRDKPRQLSECCRNLRVTVPTLSCASSTTCRLHREVEAFVKYMSPTLIEDEIRGLVIRLVLNAITAAFPDARILPFGSHEIKRYLTGGARLASRRTDAQSKCR